MGALSWPSGRTTACALGVQTDASGFGAGSDEAVIADLERWVQSVGGHYPAAVEFGCWWGNSLPRLPGRSWLSPTITDWLTEHDVTPIINFNPDGADLGMESRVTILADIAAGVHDEYLREYAIAVRDWGRPVVMRPMWEMTGDWFFWSHPHGESTATRYREAWRKMVRVFHNRGAGNARWYWNAAIRDGERPNGWRDYWVGDAWCTYTGIDVYGWSGTTKDATEVADDSMRKLRNLPADPNDPNGPTSTRRIILGEVGASETLSATMRKDFYRKPADAEGNGGFQALADRWWKLACIVQFDVNSTARGEALNKDWRLSTSPVLLDTWRDMAAMPEWQGSL